MKKKKAFFYAMLLCLSILIFSGYYLLNYKDGYRRIDIRRTYPKGQWTTVEFVELDFGQRWPTLLVDGDKILAFEQQFRQDIRNAEKCNVPWWYFYILQPDQIRITTTKGKYYVPVLYGLSSEKDTYFSKTWRSDSLRDLFIKWGYRRPNPCSLDNQHADNSQ